MISLNLNYVPQPRPAADDEFVTLEQVERRAHELLDSVGVLMARRRQSTVFIPSEVLLHGIDMLMPPERMGVIGGRALGNMFMLNVTFDVTGRANTAHVEADREKLRRALLSFERAGSGLAGWIHSHPGQGPGATVPSHIDRAQYADWARDFGNTIIGIIVVRDGFVRLWGDAIETGHTHAEIIGEGIQRVQGDRHVYQVVR